MRGLSFTDIVLRIALGIAFAIVIDTAAHADQASQPQLNPLQPRQSAARSVQYSNEISLLDDKIDNKNKMNFSDTYRKGNEKISVEVLYIENKRKALLDAKNQNSGSQSWDSIVKEELGVFCFQADGTMPAETTDDCYDRWDAVQVQLLSKLRAELIQNKSHVSNLQAKQAFEPGVTSSALSVAHVTTPKSFSDLQQDYQQEVSQLGVLTSQQYEKWVSEIPREPAKEDFAKFTKKPTQGGIAGSDAEYELDRSCHGQICYDEVAYKNALDQYKTTKLKTKVGEFSSREEYLKEDVLPNMERRGPAGLGSKYTYASTMESNDPQKYGNVGRESVKAYEAAAKAINDQAQKSKTQLGPKTDIFVLVDPESVRVP